MNAGPNSLDSDAEDRALTVVTDDRRRRRRVVVVAGVMVVVVAAAAGIWIAYGREGTKPKNTTPTVPTGLATVTKGTLSARTSVSGTLSYAGSYKVINQDSGPVTHLPKVGKVIKQCRVLYTVNGRPVMYLKGGSTPMYRDLKKNATGPDVEALNAALANCGFGYGYVDPSSSTYSAATVLAVKDMQDDLDLKETGKLGKGDVVFIDAPKIRVTKLSTHLGAQVQPGSPVLQGSSTRRQVTVAVDASLQSKVEPGDKVTITLPTGKSTSGVVSSVGTVVKKSQDGSSKVTVRIKPKDSKATGRLDQAPVGVSILTDSVKNALMVPVNALLALLDGGYGIEVVDKAGKHHIMPVELGLFDDTAGTVQITGKGVTAGMKVVVPTS